MTISVKAWLCQSTLAAQVVHPNVCLVAKAAGLQRLHHYLQQRSHVPYHRLLSLTQERECALHTASMFPHRTHRHCPRR